MVNIWLVEFRFPLIDVRNKSIILENKKKPKKIGFHIKNSVSASWDVYRKKKFFFFCHLDSVNYFSPKKVASLWEIYKMKSGTR